MIVGVAAEGRAGGAAERSPWPSTPGRAARRSARRRRPRRPWRRTSPRRRSSTHAVLVQQVLEALQVAGLRARQMPMFIITGSRIRHAISSPRSSSSARSASSVVERHDVRVLGHVGRDAGRHRRRRPACRARPRASESGTHREHHRVVVPVVRALDLHDVLAPGGGPRDADRVHRRLGAGVGEAHLVAAEAPAELLGAARRWPRSARRSACPCCAARVDRLDDLRVGVAHDACSRSRCGSRGTRCRRRPTTWLPWPSREVDRVGVATPGTTTPRPCGMVPHGALVQRLRAGGAARAAGRSRCRRSRPLGRSVGRCGHRVGASRSSSMRLSA